METKMKFASIRVISRLIAVAAIMGPLFNAGPAVAQTTNITHSIVALIVMEEVPLPSAIARFAETVGLNYILDPQLESSFGAYVSMRRTNVVIWDAFRDLLTEHRLAIITNPVTSVARIVPRDRHVEPVAAGQVPAGTNQIIPLLRLRDMTVIEGITNMAVQAHLTVSFEEKLLEAFEPFPTDRSLLRFGQVIDIRWKNITARQALLALLDNYDLNITQDQTSASWRISLRRGRNSEQNGAANQSQPVRAQKNRTPAAAGSRR
jgi:hypothetical protein